MSETAILDSFANAGEQRSIEWVMARCGYVTGSRFGDVIDKLKNGTRSQKAQNYLMEVVCERITGKPVNHYVNTAMEWGIMNESLAIMAYESLTGAMVMQPGFIHHPTIEWCGGSVDGFVGEDGIVEVKAPTTSTHIKTLLSEPCQHLPQIMGYLWITGRQWCDLVSFDPRMPPELQLYVERIARDDAYIEKLSIEIVAFLAEVDDLLAKVKARAG